MSDALPTSSNPPASEAGGLSRLASIQLDADLKQLLTRMASIKERTIPYIIRLLVEREARRMDILE